MIVTERVTETETETPPAPPVNVEVHLSPVTPEGQTEWRDGITAQIEALKLQNSELLNLLQSVLSSQLKTQEAMESLLLISEAETLEEAAEDLEPESLEEQSHEEGEGHREAPAAPVSLIGIL